MTKTDNDVTLRKDQVLALVPPGKTRLSKEDSIMVELYTNPTDTTSVKYKFAQRILKGAEEIHVLLQWRKDGQRVINGLAIAQGSPQLHMWRSMMTGSILTVFNGRLIGLATAARSAAAIAARTTSRTAGETAAQQTAAYANIMGQTVEQHFTQIHLGEALNHIVKHMVPPKALQRAKRYLRRECRKPSDMPIRVYWQNLTRMNLEELPFLPPFGANQALTGDEMLDILLCGTPKSWQREMDRQGYDPLTHNPTQVVDFMERIEQSEEFEPKKSQASTSNGKTAKTKSSHNNNKTKSSGETLYCLLHGNCSHTTNDCHALKEQAKRLQDL